MTLNLSIRLNGASIRLCLGPLSLVLALYPADRIRPWGRFHAYRTVEARITEQTTYRHVARADMDVAVVRVGLHAGIEVKGADATAVDFHAACDRFGVPA